MWHWRTQWPRSLWEMPRPAMREGQLRWFGCGCVMLSWVGGGGVPLMHKHGLRGGVGVLEARGFREPWFSLAGCWFADVMCLLLMLELV